MVFDKNTTSVISEGNYVRVVGNVGIKKIKLDFLYTQVDGETSAISLASKIQGYLTVSGSGLLPTIQFTVDQAQAFDIGNDGVNGQLYEIVSGVPPLPTGVDKVLIKCVTNNVDIKVWDSIAEILLSSDSTHVFGQYDVATNTIVNLLPRNTIQITYSNFLALWGGVQPNALSGGQWYYVLSDTSGDPLVTGIDHILIMADYSTDTDANPVRSCQAWVNSIGQYVPCQYDVINNVVSGEYVLWAGYLSQSGTSDPTVDSTAINISGETPAVSYHGTGNYRIDFTGDQLVSDTKCQTFTSSNWNGSAQFLFNCNFITTNSYGIFSIKIGASLSDSGLNKTYIQIKINL